MSTPVTRVVKKSGLAKQIFSLYKRSLKMVSNKPIETRPDWFRFVSHHFRHPDLGGGLRKRDVVAIEYYLRRGEKMLEAYSREGVKTVRPPETLEWPLGPIAKGSARDRKELEEEKEV